MSSLVTRLQVLKSWFDECLMGQAEFTAEGAAEFSQQLGVALAEADALDGYDAAQRGVGAAMHDASTPPCGEVDARSASGGGAGNVVRFPRRHRLYDCAGSGDGSAA
ncbi:MAG: hypothetical protein GEU91_14025 [Rhizobiales bacterium]|nr:hypothetical protein [Hyphomicrobiales bacterium]